MASRSPAAEARAEQGVWSAGHGPEIRYQSSVLEQIRREAVDAHLSIPRGGLEVGGVLFGTVEDGSVTIRARRPLALQYGTGPLFVLSETDHAMLARIIADAPADAELAGMVAVGWYHSHTRSDVFLSEADVAIHDRFFGESWQIALVVRPLKFHPTRAGFFFREPGGKMRTESSYREFVLEEATGAPLPEAPARKAERERVVELPEPPRERDRKPERPSVQVLPVPSPPSTNWRSAALALLVLALAAAAFVIMREGAGEPAGIGLRLSAARSDQMLIEWDRKSSLVAGSSGATIEITDNGTRTILPVGKEALTRGNVTYMRTGESVTVRMSIDRDGGRISEVSQFLGPALPKPVAPVAAALPSIMPAADESDRSRITDVRPEPVKPAQLPQATAPPPRTFTAFRMPSPSRRSAVPDPVLVENVPQVAAPLSTQQAPPVQPSLGSVPKPQAPPAAAQTVQQAPAPRPRSGRAIWIGDLRRHELLMFENGRPSSGSVSGAMPSRAARVNAYTADLAEGGLVVYAGKGAEGRSEPPGAHNGWNLTSYRYDPRRQTDVVVEQAPSAANSGRLLLRSARRNLSVIVLDWQELP